MSKIILAERPKFYQIIQMFICQVIITIMNLKAGIIVLGLVFLISLYFIFDHICDLQEEVITIKKELEAKDDSIK